MKLALAAFSILVSTSAFGAQPTVYCKSEGRVYDAQDDEGHFECAGALAQGDACYVGPRKAIIELINSDTFNWDEEWLEQGFYKGSKEISYVWADGPNEIKEKLSMSRCTPDFFAK